MTNIPTQKHVFMSYSRRDEAVMRRVAEFLRKQGINVWVDNEKLVPGTPIWEVEIEKAIKSAFAVVVVLSPDSKNSEWVRREISLAEQNHKRIFPVLVRGNEDSAITIRLITKQFVDMRKNEAAKLASLSNAISVYLEELIPPEEKGNNKNVSGYHDINKIPETTEQSEINFPPLERVRKGVKGTLPRFKQLFISVSWLLVILTALSFIKSLSIIQVENVIVIFWISIIIFGIIGLWRGSIKDFLITFCGILALFINILLRKYIPSVRFLEQSGASLFWLRTIILVILVYSGYQAVHKLPRLAPKPNKNNLQNKLLGMMIGLLNGFLIVGSLLFYYHVANYFQSFINDPIDQNLLRKVNDLMILMPPHLLSEPIIYLAVLLALILVVVILL